MSSLGVVSETRFLGVPVVRKLAQRPTGKLGEIAISTEGQYAAPFKDSKLTYTKVRSILKDPVVKFANLVMCSPVSRIQLQVTGEDPAQVAFIQNYFIDSGIVHDYLKKAVTARYYGFYVAEVRYLEDHGLIIVKRFKGLPPDQCSLVEDDMGSLTGVEYQQPGTSGEKVMLKAADGKFVLVTNRWWESESNRYGISELEEAREWAFAKRFVKDQMMRWIETQANPSLVCYYRPQAIGTVDTEGEITAENVGSRALSLAKSFRQGSCAGIPKDDQGDKLFELEYLKSENRMPVWADALRVFNLELFHSLVIPEKAISEGSGTGTYAMAQVHADFLYQLQEDFATSLLRPLNDYVIPKLLAWNFPVPDASVRIDHEGLRDSDKELVKLIVTDMMAAAKEGVPLTPEFVTYIRKETGVPIDTRFVSKAPAPATTWTTATAPGTGKGQGNDPSGTGGTDVCRCSKCGYETSHDRGIPCNEMKCPKCGGPLTGASELAEPVARFRDMRLSKYNPNVCPVCGGVRTGNCRCSSSIVHTQHDVDMGHGHSCANGHNWSEGADGEALVGHPENVRPRLARSDTKLRRALTEREKLMPGGGERYFLALKANWTQAEQDMLADLVRVLKVQEEKFLAGLETALAISNKAGRLKAIREIGLTQYPKFEQAVRVGLDKAAKMGLTGIAAELKLPQIPAMTPDLTSFLKTQAGAVTEGAMGKLMNQLRGALVQGVNQELPTNEIAFRAKGIFDGLMDKRLFGDVVRQTSTAVNYGRKTAGKLDLADPVMSMTRTSMLDQDTCPVCDHFDGMTIRADDPDVARMTPPSQCQGGHLCRCIAMYNQESMRPALREVNYKAPPVGMQEEIWY